MRKLAFLMATVALAAFIASPAFAGPSSKFAAHVKDLQIIEDQTSLAYTTVLTVPIKTPNKKDLLIGASFGTGLYTRTKVKGKLGASDSATAQATLMVRIAIDPEVAGAGAEGTHPVYPAEVVYDERIQTLNAILGGVIESCEDTCTYDEVSDTCTGEPDGIITVEYECVVTDEEIELILDTLAAHHFNFVAADLESGDHTVEVQVSIGTGGTTGDATANVSVGPGSLTVEEVRAINQDGGIVFEQ